MCGCVTFGCVMCSFLDAYLFFLFPLSACFSLSLFLSLPPSFPHFNVFHTQQLVSQIDTDLKQKSQAYNILRQTLQSIERKET